ncbi:MerR HTH family regulatory protein [Amycolatopsis marina]|uniref:MerR HTH family regulatory protein n=1 Tax=Amycolatopsis marina TaxID=490629 RepID=A0A1I1A7E7_9PSEU|nr:MerR family transcriptional regulator [Amycolatopsis marina]SFB33881.1 MerR HTH family regulatory protein [Amycolatopsis marina]
MRMAELSGESGVPVATIKYYLREGLLPPGERTSPNQARYTADHVRRLRLVRALIDVGGLSLNQVGDVLDALDEPEPDPHHVLGVAQRGITPAKEQPGEAAQEWAMDRVRAIAERRGWEFKPDSPSVSVLVSVFCTFRELGHEDLLDRLDGYGELADRIAEIDLAAVLGLPREEMVESAVVGTVLGDAMLVALRRLAQQSASSRTLRRPNTPATGDGASASTPKQDPHVR